MEIANDHESLVTFKYEGLLEWQQQHGELKRISDPKTCEATLFVGKEKEIPVQKILLERIPYFRKKFVEKSDLNLWFKLPALNATAVELLLDYVWSGQISFPFNISTLQEVLNAAHVLGIDELKLQCAKNLQEHLSVANCFKLQRVAVEYSSSSLLLAVDDFIQNNFEELTQQQDFLRLRVDEVKQIVFGFRDKASQQMDLLASIVNWLEHDAVNRKEFLPDLIKLIDFTYAFQTQSALMKTLLGEGSFLAQNVNCEKLVYKEFMKTNQQFSPNDNADGDERQGPARKRKKILLEIRQEILPRNNESEPLRQEPEPGTSRGDDGRIGSNGNGHVLVQSAEAVSNSPQQATCSSNNQTSPNFQQTQKPTKMIYALQEGRKAYLYEFDFEKKISARLHQISKFRKLSSMIQTAMGIYYIGGAGEKSEVKHVEIFEEEWFIVNGEKCPQLQDKRKEFACCVLNDTIYVIGGCQTNNGHSETTNSVEFYKETADAPRWLEFNDHLNTARAGLEAAVIDGRIYVVGGAGWCDVACDDVEMYGFNATNNVWQYVSPMLEARANHRLAVLNGKMYAVGGRTGTAANKKLLKSAEVYDPAFDRWTRIAPMHFNRANFGLIVVDDKLYAFGGSDSVFRSMEYYDTVSERWKVVAWPKNLHTKADFRSCIPKN